MMKVAAIATILMTLPLRVHAWTPQKLPHDLRSEERTWRFPDTSKLRLTDVLPTGDYMHGIKCVPGTSMIRRDNDFPTRRSGDNYMHEMYARP